MAQAVGDASRPLLHLVSPQGGQRQPLGKRRETAGPQAVEPRDPVAYPSYPRRLEGAARPIYHIEGEPLREDVVSLPVRPPRRAAPAMARPQSKTAVRPRPSQTTANGEGYVTYTVG